MIINEPGHKSPGLRERNKQDKLARIESVARRLFATQGFDATTTRQIAEEAGIGAGTLFLYFPEKLDLVLHLFAKEIPEAAGRAFASVPAGAPFPTQVAHVFAALYVQYDKDAALARVIVKELLFLEPQRRARLMGMTAPFLEGLGALARAAQARGELRGDVPPPEVATLLFGVYYFALVAWLGGVIPRADAQRWLVERALGHVLAGLAPRPTATDHTPRRRPGKAPARRTRP